MQNETNPSQPQSLLSAHEVAARLSVTTTWIYREIKAGHLPAYAVGKLHRIAESDLAAYLEARRRTPVVTGSKGGV
jgi:excisionase family DNA binding protein